MMFLPAPYPRRGGFRLSHPPTHPLLVVLSPRGLVAQDQVRILHGDEDGLVVLPLGIWFIWTYLDMYQKLAKYIKMICGYLCYVFFVDFNPLLYPFWRHAQVSQKFCNLEAELPNSSTLVFILEGKLRNYPQLWKSSPIWSRSCALNLRHPPAQAGPAAAVVSCPWSCQDDTPATAACRRDSLHPAGHTPRCLRPEINRKRPMHPLSVYPRVPACDQELMDIDII